MCALRISDLVAADLNPALLPEACSLTSRAQNPAGQIAATRLELLAATPHEIQFRTHFVDGSHDILRVFALDVKEGGWVLHLGGRSPHDLFFDAQLDDIQIEAGTAYCVLRCQAQTLRIGLAPVQFFFDHETATSHGRGSAKVQSPGADLNVGNVIMSHALFRHADGFGISLGLKSGEVLYGGGEDFGSMIKNGRIFDVYNSDALGVNGQLRYQSTPFFYSAAGYALGLLNAAPSRVDFGFRRHDIVQWSSSTPSFSLLVLAGGSADLRSAQFRLLGGAVKTAPEWSLKLWLSRCFYQNQQEVEQVVAQAKEHGISAGVVNLDARCWMRAETRTDFVWDTSRFEPAEKFLPWLRAQGYEICLWENPYVSSKTESVYVDGVAQKFFVQDAQGNPYPYQWVPTGLAGFPQPPVAGLVDFTNPAARQWWKDLHRPYLKLGVRSFKTDFGEEIPHDAVFYDGSSGWQMRNVYSDLYNLCVAEVLSEELQDEGVLWARSGFARMASTPVKWAGDSQTTWRALRATLRAGLSQSVGGALFWSHDIGGFYGPKPDSELYLRWAQMGLWGSHARTHGTSAREPWEFGPDALLLFRQALDIRNTLLPYFKNAVDTCAETAQSFLKPLWFQYPDDLACKHIDDQFLAGPDVLVAPFLDPTGGRQFYLPQGEWMSLRTGETIAGSSYVESERTAHLPVYVRTSSPYLNLFRDVAARHA